MLLAHITTFWCKVYLLTDNTIDKDSAVWHNAERVDNVIQKLDERYISCERPPLEQNWFDQFSDLVFGCFLLMWHCFLLMVWASHQILACRIARGPLWGPLAGLYAKIWWLSQMSSIVTPRHDLSWMTDMVTAQKTGSRVPRTPKNQIWKVVWPVFRFLYLAMQCIYAIFVKQEVLGAMHPSF